MKVYRSKIGLELFIPIILFLFIVSYKKEDYLISIYLILSFTLLWFIIYISTTYEINNSDLIIKSIGITYCKFDINSIVFINETLNPLSSPALSIFRLKISNGKDEILISPKKQKEFIETLLELNPNINVEYRKPK